jgi:hypothetical protein
MGESALGRRTRWTERAVDLALKDFEPWRDDPADQPQDTAETEKSHQGAGAPSEKKPKAAPKATAGERPVVMLGVEEHLATYPFRL